MISGSLPDSEAARRGHDASEHRGVTMEQPDVATILPDENGIWSGLHEYQLSEGQVPQDANGSMHESCWLWKSPRDYKLVEVTVITGLTHMGDRTRYETQTVVEPGPHPLTFGGCINGVDRFRRDSLPFDGCDRERFAYHIKLGDVCHFVHRGPGYNKFMSVRLRCWYDIPWWKKCWAEMRNNPAPYVAVLTFLVSTGLGIVKLVLGG